MEQLTFENAENDQPTKTILNLQIEFTHGPATTQKEAEDMVTQALAAYAKRQMLDIYLRDEKECAIGIDEELLLTEVQGCLRKQIVQAATAQRLEDTENKARAKVEQDLLGDQ